MGQPGERLARRGGIVLSFAASAARTPRGACRERLRSSHPIVAAASAIVCRQFRNQAKTNRPREFRRLHCLGGIAKCRRPWASVTTHKPIYTQVGYATWYTAPYKGRRSANGEVFDDRSLTAANRTLPMGSLIVVTNLQTGQSAAMRIADRGPFVEDRILDLTVASAKATGV